MYFQMLVILRRGAQNPLQVSMNLKSLLGIAEMLSALSEVKLIVIPSHISYFAQEIPALLMAQDQTKSTATKPLTATCVIVCVIGVKKQA